MHERLICRLTMENPLLARTSAKSLATDFYDLTVKSVDGAELVVWHGP